MLDGKKQDLKRQINRKIGRKMIVKIRTKDEGWYYFDVDSVKVRTLTKEQYECGVATNVPDVLEVSGLKEQNKDATYEGIKCVNCSKENKSLIIYTNMIAYILNNEGKTVERII